MDKYLAMRLDSANPRYDAEFFGKMSKLARDYVNAGQQTLTYYVADMDAANDAVNAYASIPANLVSNPNAQWDRMKPRNFIHPMTATEMTTLATFVSQILFGGQTTRRVEPRKDTDEKAADAVNELLQWNDDQQDTYNQGYLFCWDAMTFNRGVWYEHWQPTIKVEVEKVTEEIPAMVARDQKGRFNKKIEPETQTRWRKTRKVVGGFNKIEPVSPYDFICDPMLPLRRMQEGRFTGHRVMIPWLELKRRSELPTDDYMYVLPEVVQKLKNQPIAGGGSSMMMSVAMPSMANGTRSRTYYERMRRGNPSGYSGATEAVNKEDGGVVECFCLYVRLSPATYDIYDDTEPEIIEILTAGDRGILSVNIMPNTHDEYPYGVGEARPNAHYQFSPSWALMIKPIQDYVDYLKQRRQESVARTSGNIFIGDPVCVDFQAFTDPDKDGLIIPITEEGRGRDINSFFRQIPVNDTTANFYQEMQGWMGQAENTTGAHAQIQGKTDDTDQTATQFAGVQQMGVGRISSIARILSVQAIQPQTRRFVCNFQQFMPEQMVVRITGDTEEYDPDEPPSKYLLVSKADIQAEFDIIPHDGSLPGTDAKQVAAISRVIEASANPVFAACYDDTVPGSLDPKKLLYEAAKKSGMRLANFIVSREAAQRNAMQKMMAAGGGIPPGLTQPGGPTPPPASPAPGLPMPSASALPTTPPAAPPGPSPGTV
jgi:hypothetical protein